MSDDVPTPTNTAPIDVNKRVEQYIRLRDLKAEKEAKHKEELEPLATLMADIESELMTHMNAISADSLKTAAGTVSKTTKKSASAADLSAFWTWVVTQGQFDMLDKKPNVTAVADYVKQNGVPPPGVNYSEFAKLGFRRKS